MGEVALAVVAALVGVAVVGPVIGYAVLWWRGWQVVLPLLLGGVPPARALGLPPVRCRRCGAPLGLGALPVLPATVRRWRCRSCGERLAAAHGAVELAAGAVFAAVAAATGWSPALAPLLCLAAGSVAMSVVDLAVMRIPTAFVRTTGALVAAGLVGASLVDGPLRRLGGALLGALLYGGLLLTLHLVSPRAMGFGDVRLATVVGAVVGWCSWRADQPALMPAQGVFTAGLVAGLLGSVVGVVLLAVRRRNQPFPFGPAVAAGGLVVALVAV